ncbi:MAG: hypothetical protein J6S23_08885 [Clostridia bacterium]|nr:hypothetical protein [Clostridia bacterium]
MNFKQNIIEEDTTGYFQTLNNESIDFLKQKKCPSELLDYFINGLQGFATPNSFEFEDIELSIDYFLGCSDNDTYDIVDFNKYFNSRENYVAIGVLAGEDTFGFVPGEKGIYISLDTDSNVDEDIFVCIAQNIEEFLNLVFE